MKCWNCNTELIEDAVFCHICGQKAKLVCRECQTELLNGASFCYICGTKVEEDRTEEFGIFEASEVSETFEGFEEENEEDFDLDIDFLEGYSEDEEEESADSFESFEEEQEDEWIDNAFAERLRRELSPYAERKEYGVSGGKYTHDMSVNNGWIIITNGSDTWIRRETGEEKRKIHLNFPMLFRDEIAFVLAGINRKGIFVLYYRETGNEDICLGGYYLYDVDGTFIGQYSFETEDYTNVDTYIYDDIICIADKNEEHNHIPSVCYYERTADGKLICHTLMEGMNDYASFSSVSMNEKYITWKAKLVDDNDYNSETVWYLYERVTERCVCLNAPKNGTLDPRNIVQNTDAFDDIEDEDRVEIYHVFLDKQEIWSQPTIAEVDKFKFNRSKYDGHMVGRKLGFVHKSPIAILRLFNRKSFCDGDWPVENMYFDGEEIYRPIPDKGILRYGKDKKMYKIVDEQSIESSVADYYISEQYVYSNYIMCGGVYRYPREFTSFNGNASDNLEAIYIPEHISMCNYTE